MTKITAATLLGAGIVIAGAASCRDLVVECPNPGPTWEVSPPEVNLAVGQVVRIDVVEITCAGRRQNPVYPDMIVADTMVATTDLHYRYVRGRSPGTTALNLVGHDIFQFNRTIPVTIR